MSQSPDRLIGVRFWTSPSGDIEFAPWDAGQQSKHLAQRMHLELQAAETEHTPVLTADALPAIAIIGKRVEVYPPLLDTLGRIPVLRLPLRDVPLTLTVLDQLSGNAQGIAASELQPLDIAHLPAGLFFGLAFLAASMGSIALKDDGRPQNPDDAPALRTATQALWEQIQLLARVMATYTPTIHIPIPAKHVRPGHIRKVLERTILAVGFEQARQRGELGGAGERYLPAAYAQRIASAKHRMHDRLDQRPVCVHYVTSEGASASFDTTILQIKQWADAQNAAFDLARTERMARLIAADRHAPAMLTVTLPPSWHATARRSHATPEFAGHTAADGSQLLQQMFRLAYQVLYKQVRKLGLTTCLVRALEPHTDGTPHMHIVGAERDLRTLTDHIAQIYPLEEGQRLCRVVQHRAGANGVLQSPKRCPTYRTLADWAADTPVIMGMVGVAMQLDCFTGASPNVTHRLVHYLTRYVNADDADSEQDLAGVLNDRFGKPKGAAGRAWHRAAGLTARKIGWSGMESNKAEWLAVHRMSVARRTAPELAAVLARLLRDWSAATGTWADLKTIHAVDIRKDDDDELCISAAVARHDDRGVQLLVALGGPVRTSVVERVPDLDAAPAHIQAAAREQLTYRDNQHDGFDTSPPLVVNRTGGRGEPTPTIDALPELSVCDMLGAIEGVQPTSVLAAPGSGKTTAIARGLLQWQAIHDHAGEHPAPILLLYRQRQAAIDTTETLRARGVRAKLVIGRRSHDDRAKALIRAASANPVVIVATVDSLLCGRLRRWRGVVLIDEVQDLHAAQIGHLRQLEDLGSIDIGLCIGDRRQALLPDAPPHLVQAWGTSWFMRGLSVSRRCPSRIAQAASAASPDYPPILAAHEGGTFSVETLDTRLDAVRHAALHAVTTFRDGHSVVVQADTHESLHRIHAVLREEFGQHIPEGISTRTPAGAKGGTWDVSVYLVDIEIGGVLVAERPQETAATAITRARHDAHIVTYRLAD